MDVNVNVSICVYVYICNGVGVCHDYAAESDVVGDDGGGVNIIITTYFSTPLIRESQRVRGH